MKSVVVVALLATASTAVRAEEATSPGSLPAVTARMYTVGGRVEVQPVFGFSLGDPFFRSVMGGARVEVHLDERWSLSADALAGLSLVSAPIQVCGADACANADPARLRSTPGDLQMATGLSLGYRPIYGKLSLIGDKTIHFDFFVHAGPEVLLERIAQDAISAPQGRWNLGAKVGLGERFWLSERFTVRVGASELMWGSRVRGRVEIQRKLMLEAGVAWLFGSAR